MPRIQVRDSALYYERSGNGPNLFFIHGMCGDGRVWDGQVTRLSDRITCITYDRPGHGRAANWEASLNRWKRRPQTPRR